MVLLPEMSVMLALKTPELLAVVGPARSVVLRYIRTAELGTVVPVTTIFAWPVVVGAYVSGEMSSNAGGLIRWPVYALVPIGFALLGLQAISELIKRFAFLQGKAPNPLLHGAHESNEAHDAEHAQAHHDDAGEVRK